MPKKQQSSAHHQSRQHQKKQRVHMKRRHPHERSIKRLAQKCGIHGLTKDCVSVLDAIASGLMKPLIDTTLSIKPNQQLTIQGKTLQFALLSKMSAAGVAEQTQQELFNKIHQKRQEHHSWNLRNNSNNNTVVATNNNNKQPLLNGHHRETTIRNVNL